jgi:hypothetical protein
MRLGLPGVPRPAGNHRPAGAGLQPAVRQQPGHFACFSQRDLRGILDVGKHLAGAQGSLAQRLGRRPGRRQGQPAQQRPEFLPVIRALGEFRAQRHPGLLHEGTQPLGWMNTGPRRPKAVVELIAHDLAGLRLQVEQAGRPGEGAGPGENAFMGFPPPRLVRAAASQAIGQLPERRPIRIRPRLPPQLPERRLALGPPLLHLLGPPLRVAADALPVSPGLAGVPFPGGHARQRSGRR